MQSQFWLVMAQYWSLGAGVSFDQLAYRALLDILPPEASAASLTRSQLDRLLVAADDHLASLGSGIFASALRVDLAQMTGLCALLCAKPSFGAACDHLSHTLQLTHPGYRCALESRPDDACSMTFSITQVAPAARGCHEQVVFGLLLNLLRHFPSEDDGRIRQVIVSPALLRRYPELAQQDFGLEVSDERSGIVMDDVILSRRARYHSVGMERTLQMVFDTFRAHDRILESHAGQVVDILLERLKNDQGVSLREVAFDLGLKRRTLQQYLGNENITFNYLRGHVMSHVACDLLAEGRAIDEVVRRLGYSSRSAFHHAFTRNTGLRPTQARRGMLPQRPSTGAMAPPPSTL